MFANAALHDLEMPTVQAECGNISASHFLRLQSHRNNIASTLQQCPPYRKLQKKKCPNDLKENQLNDAG